MSSIEIAAAHQDTSGPDDRGHGPSVRERAFSELEASVYTALKTYANVHRGTGPYSLVTTRLYEQARDVVVDHLGLDKRRFAVVFCTPERASALRAIVKPNKALLLSSRDMGLPLGVRALVAMKSALPGGVPFQTGGGTTRMVSRASVIWEDAPDRLEAGTPAILNIIAFARALQITRRLGPGVFETRQPAKAAPGQILYSDEFEGLKGRKLLRHLRHARVGRDTRVPTTEGYRPLTYLDNGASTPTFLPVWEAVRRTWKQPERQRRLLVAEVKEICARFMNISFDKYDLIFTSNTTEAINLVARSLALERAPDSKPVVLNSLLEHNSNELPWRYAEGVSLVRLPVDDEGFADLSELERVLRAYNLDRIHGTKRIRIVAVSGASNVLGTYPDIKEIGRKAHAYQARLLVDAAQLAGHRKMDLEGDAIDFLAFSGHKMYAPFGSGGLVVRKGLLNFPEEKLARIKASGEENAAGIAALGKAMDLLQRVGLDVIRDEEQRLMRAALAKLSTVPRIEIFGIKDPDSPRFQDRGGVISFSLKHVPHNLVAEYLADQGGIGVRNGCFCAHLLVKRLLRIHPAREALANLSLIISPTFTQSVLPGLVRVSFGLENDGHDVDHLVKTLKKIAARRISIMDRLFARMHNATPVLPASDVRKNMRAYVENAASQVYEPGRLGQQFQGGQRET